MLTLNLEVRLSKSFNKYSLQKSPDGSATEEYGIEDSDTNRSLFRIQGFISTCQHGAGRGSTDRQMYFINKRPCDLSKLSRLVNDVYHMYNRQQYPFVILDISLASDCVDVNVTPDKRQIFVQKEKLLLGTVKTSLIHMFEGLQGVYNANNPITTEISSKQGTLPLSKQRSCPETSPRKSVSSSLSNLKRSFSSSFASELKDEGLYEQKIKQRKLDTFLSPRNSIRNEKYDDKEVTETKLMTKSRPEFDACEKVESQKELRIQNSFKIELIDEVSIKNCEKETLDEPHAKQEKNDEILNNEDLGSDFQGSFSDENDKRTKQDCEINKNEFNTEDTVKTCGKSLIESYDENQENCADQHEVVTEYDLKSSTSHRKSTTVQFSFNKLKQRMSESKKMANSGFQSKCSLFRAKINPGENQRAEEELNKTIRKDDFTKMEILGQFNLGFIIGKLGTDLFIIDQHAINEKYNFEMLQVIIMVV